MSPCPGPQTPSKYGYVLLLEWEKPKAGLEFTVSEAPAWKTAGIEGGSRRKTKHSAKTVRLGLFCAHRCYFHERVLYLLLFRWDKESELALLSEIYAACFPSPPGLILSSSLDFEVFFFSISSTLIMPYFTTFSFILFIS